MKEKLSKSLMYLFLTLIAAANVLPILWMAVNSLKTDREYAADPFALPAQAQWTNYAQAWEKARLGTYFGNSLFITAAAVTCTVLLASMAAYFLSRVPFRGGRAIHTFFLFGMLIPVHATLIPVFLVMQKLSLLNTRLALIIVYTAVHIPITIYILSSFMREIPGEMEEAAVIDGSTVFKTFFLIILPMSVPALATVFILNVLYNWNEYLISLVLIRKQALFTIPIGIAAFSDTETSYPTLQMAALILVLVPTLIFFTAVQKYLVRGLVAGAVKG